ncbi:MAG: hypothetical protein IJ736_11905 [Firmicutes bacterium]|nr:hypothetical protein [Bacillota bacterium]
MNEKENVEVTREQEEIEIDIHDIIFILMKNVRIICLSAILFAILAFLVSAFVIKPTYTAKITMYVNNAKKITTDSMNYNDISASVKLVNSYMQIIKSNVILNEVIDICELDYDNDELAKLVTTEQVEDTEIFSVSVATHSQDESMQIANTIANIAPDKIKDFVEASSVKVIYYDEYPERPTSPNIPKYTVFGFIFGLALSIGISFLVEFLNTKVTSEEDLQRISSFPIIGTIPEIKPETSAN